jgi:hypothetical protein
MWAIANTATIQSSHHVVKPQPSSAPIDFDALALLSIFNHEQQITVVERPASVGIAQYLNSVALSLGRGFQLTIQAGESVTQHVLQQRLVPQHAGDEYLLADIDLLAHLYFDLMGCPRIGLRLEVLQAAMCPKFHVDRTGIRLLCTYMGPGTEWLDDRYADRSKLGISTANVCDTNSGLILDSAGLHQAPAFAIALLKGSLWQGNEQRGVIHRSPAVVSNQIRVMLAIDALW